MTEISLDLVTEALQRSDPIRTANARAQLLALAGIKEGADQAGTEFSTVLAAEMPDGSSTLPSLSQTAGELGATPAEPSTRTIEKPIDGPRLREDATPSVDGAPSDAAKAFEAFVLTSLVKAMLPPSGAFFGSSAGTGVWRSMLAEKLAEEIAGRGGIGVADMLSQQADRGGALAGQSDSLIEPGVVPSMRVGTAVSEELESLQSSHSGMTTEA